MKSLQRGGKCVRMLATCAAAILTMGLGATSAQAWIFQDDLETNASTNWRFEHSGTGGGALETAGYYSRSGLTDAYIYASSGFSSVGRTVDVQPYFGTQYAAATIYLRPYGTNVKVNFEVIDPRTWTYISLKTVTLSNSYTYQAVETDWFVPPQQFAYIRVSVLGSGGVDVDDLSVIVTVIK